MISEVPFPNARGCVALLLKNFSDSCFIWIESFSGIWEEDPLVVLINMHVQAARITAGEQTGSGRGADSAGDIKVSESHAFLSHLVQDGRAVLSGSKATNV